MMQIRNVRRGLMVVLLGLMLISDYVAWREVKHAMSWIIGSNATFAAGTMLFMANAVTMAFFFDGLSKRQVKFLHSIAIMLYGVVLLAIYSSGVESGLQMFPATVAAEAFGMSRVAAVRMWALLIGTTLAVASAGFWGVMGSLIGQQVANDDAVTWQERAERSGLPTDNILGMRQMRDRQTGS